MMTRRSIRKYSEKEVSNIVLEKILKCAMQAPSGVNEQAWEFIIVRDKELLKQIPTISPFAGMVAKAPLAIIVCTNLNNESIFYKGMGILDCSAATENILLAAHALGLGAVWTAVYPDEAKANKIRNLFNIPSSIIPLCIIPIGYPAEKKGFDDRYKEKKVHQNKW